MPTTKHWTTEPDGEVNVKTMLSGPASASPTTVSAVFKKTSQRLADHPALRVKRNGEWKTWTWQDYYGDVARAAKSLIKLGMEPFHGVCILGFNSPEWHISLLSAIMAGGLGVGVYPTNSAEACCHIANNCTAQVIIAEDKKQLDKIFAVRDKMAYVLKVVQYSSAEPVAAEYRDQGVISWEEFLNCGIDVPDYEVSWRIEKQKPGNCASLIYTSGTTGPPKGVMVSHDNITWTARICVELYNMTFEDQLVSYLPLSHIAAQMIDIIAPLCSGATVWFAQPDAMKGTLKNTLEEVRPTMFMGVPRVWEKIKEAVQLQVQQTSGFKKWAFDKASEIGMQTSFNKQQGSSDKPWGYFFADKLIFQGVRKKLGLDRCRCQVTGAAPIDRSVVEFFMQLDVPIYEMYGMSECTGPHTVSLPSAYKLGSAGKAMVGVEMKIDNPNEGDGEICFRGRHVFMGYLKEERKTREVLDEDGWLHSGDVGNVDDNGFLTITGRIKEILITKGGENVAPVPVESLMKEELPLLSHCCVIGNDQKYLTMLVTFKCEMDDLTPTDKLSPMGLAVMSQLGSLATSVKEATADPLVTKYITEGMKKVNEKSVSRAAKVQKFRVCPEDFSIPGGELTPTMKVKRKAVTEKYKDLIAEMYEESSLV
ncbi:long-chain-fatty-acid--CoA ligase ACSBG2-like isoform X2 [Dysidea avara]|uniref:long-chain-fatty-acid--CoA ligase ACSBG2-like isoform X2 n=1 Tax=Dysidea avara TaxID=196820 RepID=UPI00332E8AC9